MNDSHPELDDRGDDRPVRTARRRRALRIVVLVALAGMVLPLVLSAYGVARAAAERACAIYALDYSALATSSVSFEPFAEGGPGWLCFAQVGPGDRGILLGNLGLMPAAPRPSPGREA
ncbi:hypothetical protein [Agromyces arachidis]|uniref:hypothetical protein n=1 Tax=Agromyces arachidis TaxID=766966 RepID=UPI0040567618